MWSELLAVLHLAERMVRPLEHLSSPMGRELDRVAVLVLEAAEAVVLMSRSKMTYSLALERPISYAPSVSLLMEVMTSHAACPSRCLDILDQR